MLKMAPFHFDRWMVSLVRWTPILDAHYPFEITFWVQLVELPLQYWAEPTFWEVGKALGRVEAVDINGGRVQVTVNGYKPFVFETEVDFKSGKDVPIFLHYERLVGWCNECHSLCHDMEYCPTILEKERCGTKLIEGKRGQRLDSKVTKEQSRVPA